MLVLVRFFHILSTLAAVQEFVPAVQRAIAISIGKLEGKTNAIFRRALTYIVREGARLRKRERERERERECVCVCQ